MKFRLVEAENYIHLVRGENGSNYSANKINYGGIFFEPWYVFDEFPDSAKLSNDFGKLSHYKLDTNSKIYTDTSPISFAKQNCKTFTQKQKSILQRISSEVSEWLNCKSVDDFFNKIDAEYDISVTDGEWFAIYQYIARDILENDGYDGAHWTDDPYEILTPDEYQIWNLDKVKKMNL